MLTPPFSLMAMTGKINIRPVRAEDAERLVEIYAHYVSKTAVSFEYDVPTLEEFEKRIERISSFYPYLVGEVDGRIVAYTYAHEFGERKAYSHSVETTIYIDKDMRRCGLGRLLYTELEKALGAMNITNLYACIATVDEEDEYLTHDSIKFHTHMGYHEVAHLNKCGYKFSRWYDMVYMEKIIGEHLQSEPEVLPKR